MHRLLYFSYFLVVFSTALAQITPSYACNNSPDLCTRSYANVTHLGAHDSPFIRDQSNGFSLSGNQNLNTTLQLQSGVRLLTAQVHKFNNALNLCHTSCDLLNTGSLSSWLKEIRRWMDQNPHEVVTVLLVNSDNAAAKDLHNEFLRANITNYAYTPRSAGTALSTWPTLNEMISNGTRLVAFVANIDSSAQTVAPYLLDEFTYIFENPYEVSSLTNFTCSPDRPSSVRGQTSVAIESGRLPLMNHILYDLQSLLGASVPDIDNITTTNAPSNVVGSLGIAADDCKKEYGKIPTFVLVDFFDQGPAIETVDRLNGITAVGRINTTEAAQKVKISQTNSAKGNRCGYGGLGLVVSLGIALMVGWF
ncbi:MAG: hypothetical protein Q9167_007499 [Letrouitia subvulpina]